MLLRAPKTPFKSRGISIFLDFCHGSKVFLANVQRLCIIPVLNWIFGCM